MPRLEQFVYTSKDGSKAPLAFDNSENSLLATSIKAIDNTVEWLLTTKAIGKQLTNITDARILKYYTDYDAYLFDDVNGVKGSQAIVIGDINTRGYGFQFFYNNLLLYTDVTIDLLTNTYAFTIQYDGNVWFYAFTDIMDLFPGSKDFSNLSYEKALFATSDQLSGSDLNDKLYGYAGNDLIFGNAGDDTIVGGLGNDSLVGNSGNDNISGEEGDDMIWGSAGNDVLTGGDGNDEIFGGTGGDGTKTLGQDGDDIIYGEGGNDKLWGEDGKDIIYGGIGDDYIHGG
ncbi:MAG: calcium-binding protein, partial [Chitinophagia bacterium]|nr:calcium-binding protein [Chitinophagia bacterium]